MSSRIGICRVSSFRGGSQLRWPALKSASQCPLWLSRSLTDPESLLSADSRCSDLPVWNALKHQRDVGFIPGYSQSISLQSGDSSPFCLFLFHIRSEPTGGRLIYRSHGNCPRKAKSVWWRRKKEKTLYLPVEGQLLGGAWAVFPLLTELFGPRLVKINQNKVDTVWGPQSAQVGNIHSPQGQSTDGLCQEGPSCGGGGNTVLAWRSWAICLLRLFHFRLQLWLSAAPTTDGQLSERC